MRNLILAKVADIPPSGLRRFFDIAATMNYRAASGAVSKALWESGSRQAARYPTRFGRMKDVISLGIGEPDFVTPLPIVSAGIESLNRGEMHYTSNLGTVELRRALAGCLKRLYGVEYDPTSELLITVGVCEALYLALTAVVIE